MRRFPLRLKIAAFAAGLVALAVGLVAFFTVIQPWRAKLVEQEKLARHLAQTALPLGVELRPDGTAHFDPVRMHALVANASDIVYALLWDDKSQFDAAASSVNLVALHRVAEPLAQLYLNDRTRALDLLASGKPQPGIRRLPIRLAARDRPGSHIGRLDLGLSTVSIDAELRRSLFRDAIVLAATMGLAILGALWIAARIARPLSDLSAAMGRLQQGDFEVSTAAAVQVNDEVGDLARAFNQMAQGLKDRERLRGTLGRYVSGDVAARILEETDDLDLPGELRRVTIMFLDVRGFTTISERLKPTEIVALLNEYFDVVVDRVTAHGGTVNKFIGDAAMCIWGAPRQVEFPERSAVQAALEIQQALARLSADRVRRGLLEVGFGVGINSGEAIAGNLGAARRLEYTVIGDAVNVASRLESQSRGGEVLISQSVYEKVERLVEAVPREPVKLKGKSQPVPLWEVKRLAAAATEAA
jgi:class 3 adenylate cyclase